MAEPNTDLDVVDELTIDHREALALLDQIGTSTDPAERRDLADTVIAEVVRHAVAEEMYVYPAVRYHLASGEQVVQHDIEEHKQLEQVMKQLEKVECPTKRGRVNRELPHSLSIKKGEREGKIRESPCPHWFSPVPLCAVKEKHPKTGI